MRCEPLQLDLFPNDPLCSDCGRAPGVRVEPRQWYCAKGFVVSNVGAVFTPKKRFYCSSCADERRALGEVFPTFVPLSKRGNTEASHSS